MKAIAFPGVPHNGSNSARWAGFAANLLKSASIRTSTNTAIVSDMEKGSITLQIFLNNLLKRHLI